MIKLSEKVRSLPARIGPGRLARLIRRVSLTPELSLSIGNGIIAGAEPDAFIEITPGSCILWIYRKGCEIAAKVNLNKLKDLVIYPDRKAIEISSRDRSGISVTTDGTEFKSTDRLELRIIRDDVINPLELI